MERINIVKFTPYKGFRSFKLEKEILIRFLKEIKNENNTPKKISKKLGMGEPKVKENLKWAERCSLIVMESNKFKITEFGKIIEEILMEDHPIRKKIATELMYYELVKNDFIIFKLVNDYIFPNRLMDLEIQKIKEFFYNFKEEMNCDKTQINNRISMYVNTLTDSDSFGELKILSKNKDKIVVNSHLPHWKTIGYNIYDFFELESITRIKINDFIKACGFGRIFMLDWETVKLLLESLESNGLIIIESAANLNQIALKNNFSNKYSFLRA